MRRWLTLTDEERDELKVIVNSGLTPKNQEKRAKVILLAEQVDMNSATVMRWIARFRDGPAGSDMKSVAQTKDGQDAKWERAAEER